MVHQTDAHGTDYLDSRFVETHGEHIRKVRRSITCLLQPALIVPKLHPLRPAIDIFCAEAVLHLHDYRLRPDRSGSGRPQDDIHLAVMRADCTDFVDDIAALF
jgi:hypothetical protein